MRRAPLDIRIQGFTLVELLVSIAIVGILLAWAMPNFSALFERARVRGVGEEFASVLKLARSEAMLNNNTVFIQVDPGADGSTWCWGVNTGAACNCTVAGACLVRGQERRNTSVQFSRISMTTATGAAFSMSIDGRGLVAGNNWVQFESGTTEGRVGMTVVGRVRTCSGTLTGWLPMKEC